MYQSETFAQFLHEQPSLIPQRTRKNLASSSQKNSFQLPRQVEFLHPVTVLDRHISILTPETAEQRELCTHGGERPTQVAGTLVVELAGLDEPVCHALEVLLGDDSVVVEVDALEVGVHLLLPEVRASHDDGSEREKTTASWSSVGSG